MDNDRAIESIAIGGAGVLFGWLLHKPKPAGQVVLSNLVIPSSALVGDEVGIMVDVTNTGNINADANIIIQIGDDVMESPVSLIPGETRRLGFIHVVAAGSHPVSASVDPLQATISGNVPF